MCNATFLSLFESLFEKKIVGACNFLAFKSSLHLFDIWEDQCTQVVGSCLHRAVWAFEDSRAALCDLEYALLTQYMVAWQ
mmetsp:Transcript_33817/g.100705  ORF Transcript_33817/g.100705 Transcript_33817/m.100705 type:complete len:80 (+) Transcript_33817:2561-2800(+)